MAILHVRNVPDDVYTALKARAAAEGRSLSAEVLLLLEREFGQPRRSVRALLASIERRSRLHPLPPGAPDVVDVLREDHARG